jgi:thioredoxin-like negative regulator of GroEL
VIFFAALAACAGALIWWRYAGQRDLNREWEHAQLALDVDDFPTARRTLEICRQGWPLRADVVFELARLERRTGNSKRARQGLLEARRLGCPADQIENEVLLLQAESGGVKAVAPRLQPLPSADPREASFAFEALVKGWLQLSNLGDAHITCDTWTARFPDDWRARYWLGWVLEKESYAALAVDQFRLAAKANPTNFDVQLRLAEALVSTSAYPEALPCIESCLKSKPDDARARLAHARCLQALGDTRRAEEVLQSLLHDDSQNAAALLLQARLRLGQEDAAGAVESARRAATLDPANAAAASTLAEALRGVGQDAEAVTREETARRLTEQTERITQLARDAARNPRDAETRYQLGSLLFSLGRRGEAISWWRGALTIDPEHAKAKKALQDLSDH